MTNDWAFYLKNTERNWPADCWTETELLEREMVLDAYEQTMKAQHFKMLTNLFHGFCVEHGATWEDNLYNDDIMWMVIALTRAHLLIGNPECLVVAQTNFDLCYDRAASTKLGDELWWKVDVRSKDAYVNGPGSIAVSWLGKFTGIAGYFRIDTNLFLWKHANLFDATAGRISGSIRENGRMALFALTYNQGTFVGEANFLGYTNKVRLEATCTMNRMCHDGYLPPDGEDGDGGGFKGISVRWIARFMMDCAEQVAFEPWLQKTSEAAWQSRRSSDNLSRCRWALPMPEGRRDSWGCSNAVVILQVVRPAETVELDVK